ncbi:hypothetical protein EV294_105459 [Paenibacillus sp. BK033]|nr:hypothetical protein EV294_105459 [Paenibacillus sp. BK033]
MFVIRFNFVQPIKYGRSFAILGQSEFLLNARNICWVTL